MSLGLSAFVDVAGASVPTSSGRTVYSAALSTPSRLRGEGRQLTSATSSRARPCAESSSTLAAASFVAGASAAAAVSRGATRRRRARCSPRSDSRGSRAVWRVAWGVGRQGAHADEQVLDTVVVGAGISGLCTAFGLQKEYADAKVTVTEANDVVGGNILTRSADGRLWEEGPNSYTPGDAMLTMACDLGLKEDILLANSKSYRYVWVDGKLRALPASLSDAIFGDFLSIGGKIRALLGAFGFKRPMPDHEESLRDFVTRNLGEEAFDNLIDPFVSGVYAGDPAKLSAEAAFGRAHVLEQKAGSLFGGVRQMQREKAKESQIKKRDPRLPEVKGQTVGSFRLGMRQFADALAAHVEQAGTPVLLNWKLRALSWDASSEEHVLEYDTPGGPQHLRCRSLVLTAPSYVTGPLLRPLSGSAADALQDIRYPSVAVLNLEYPKSAFREPEHGKGPVNGFGQLHPRSQGLRTLGTIYSSSLFPSREPDEDKVMLVYFIGGDQDPKLYGGIGGLSEGELVEVAHQDALTTMLKPAAAEMLPRVLGIKVWPRAIPQFEIGHAKRLEQAQDGLASAGVKGMFLAGNYVAGVALGSCVEHGLKVAKDVADFVKEPLKQRETA